MNITELQQAIGTPADGRWGPASRAALVNRFRNPGAPLVTPGDLAGFALRLGCTVKQLQAVAAVESSGSGFDATGKPRILFERHIFHRLTGGKFSPAPFSAADYGGYDVPSWSKLADAAGKNPDAAFSSCSWGRFQVMGMHWKKLGYASAFDLATGTVMGEVGHFELLARYIETFGLKDELAQLGTDPADCAPFAKAYNGPDFARNRYDRKLAMEMAK